jgi:flagellar assembly factor FliW
LKLLSKYHGEINFQDEDIICFPYGLPGFEKLKKFIIVSIEGNEEFSILQSIEDGEVGLIITNPFIFNKNYEVEIPDFITVNLKIETPEQVTIYTTVTLNSCIDNITSNLKAPIIINKDKKLGEQYIMEAQKYAVRYPLFKEEKNVSY